jgi:hypothetical protein
MLGRPMSHTAMAGFWWGGGRKSTRRRTQTERSASLESRARAPIDTLLPSVPGAGRGGQVRPQDEREPDDEVD